MEFKNKPNNNDSYFKENIKEQASINSWISNHENVFDYFIIYGLDIEKINNSISP